MTENVLKNARNANDALSYYNHTKASIKTFSIDKIQFRVQEEILVKVLENGEILRLDYRSNLIRSFIIRFE